MAAIVVVADNKNAAGEEAKNDVKAEHTAVNGGVKKTTTERESYLRNDYRILVSSNKKPFLFYLNLAKKYINQYHRVELCALGTAIPTVIIISENLKRNGMAIEKNITISTLVYRQDKGRVFRKAKIEIQLVKAGAMDPSTDATTPYENAHNKAIAA